MISFILINNMEIKVRNYWGSVILNEYKSEIERYCERNMLSVYKIYHSSFSGNNEEGRVFILGEGDPSRAHLGMLDDVPLPVLLEIYLENGRLRFVQTEHTHELMTGCAAAPQAPCGEIPRLAFA
jgi:hypothetical protein